MRLSARGIFARVCVMITGLILTLVISEVALRFISPFPKGYWVWPPNFRFDLDPLPGVAPGVSGPKQFLINGEGIRGDIFAVDQNYRILTIGGSTTECLYLNQTEAWPYLVQKSLNEKGARPRTWVGNVGRSGFNTRHHVLEMKYLLPQYPKIDAVILMVAANDLTMRLGADTSYDPDFLSRPGGEEAQIPRAFWFYPLGQGKWWELQNTAWWRLLRETGRTLFSRRLLDHRGEYLVQMRERRENAVRLIDTPPDLTSGLDEFARNLNRIVDIAQNSSVRVIFVTQPSLYRKDLTAEEKSVLWGGCIGDFEAGSGQTYLSVPALLSSLERYQKTLQSVCAARDVECVDLAGVLPKTLQVFYDDYHFNEHGSALVAEIISRYLISNPPSQQQRIR